MSSSHHPSHSYVALSSHAQHHSNPHHPQQQQQQQQQQSSSSAHHPSQSHASSHSQNQQPFVQPGEPLNDFLRSFWQRQITTAEEETPDYRHPPLPLARIKKVMKSDPDVKMIAADAPILFCKACEIFIAEITARAFIVADSNKRRTLSRADIAKALGKSDQFDFLIDIVPREEAGFGAAGSAGAGAGAGGSGSGGGGPGPSATPSVSVSTGGPGGGQGQGQGQDPNGASSSSASPTGSVPPPRRNSGAMSGSSLGVGAPSLPSLPPPGSLGEDTRHGHGRSQSHSHSHSHSHGHGLPISHTGQTGHTVHGHGHGHSHSQSQSQHGRGEIHPFESGSGNPGHRGL